MVFAGRVLSVLLATAPALAAPLPPDALIIGLEGDEWKLFASDGQGLHEVPTASEPRTPDLCSARGTVVYIDAAGALREVSLADGNERVLLQSGHGGDAYTQPAYDADCRSVFVVRLAEGSSADTDIVRLNSATGRLQPVVVQRSSQFEPVAGPDGLVYYGSVHCTVGCGRIIEELWKINLASGMADQVTLMNAVSQRPVPTRDGKALVYSSNRDGHFHIWRQSLATGEASRLTSGTVTDVSPAVDARGDIYFIRRTPTGTALMHWSDGTERIVTLEPALDDLRDLRIDWPRSAREVKTP